MAKIKVCAYCRVSTKDKEQLTSFENQIAYFQREFGENENYELSASMQIEDGAAQA